MQVKIPIFLMSSCFPIQSFILALLFDDDNNNNQNFIRSCYDHEEFIS